MFSSAEKFAREAPSTCDQKMDEVMGSMQAEAFEPQELMAFLEFCADKIHRERKSRRPSPPSTRIK